MTCISSLLLRYLVLSVVFVYGTTVPILAGQLSSQDEKGETQIQNQQGEVKPTLPRKDVIPPPDPEPEPRPEAHESNRLGNIFPQPMEPGLPPPPMPQPMEPGLPEPPMPQPADPGIPDQSASPEVGVGEITLLSR
jgi:hypothetical protein